jgi:ABC-2 type transport system ATP-binding protein
MIEVTGLTKRYGSVTAVDNLTFCVPDGRVTGFLGPNGAGKSTTMRMILGLDGPDGGQALVNGVPYRELARPLTQVGALLDAKWVHPNRTAAAHLGWVARSNGLSKRRVDEVLDLVGLTAVAGKRAGTFSLGMSQRLGIAGALLGDPPILMFDEPVNGLDPEGILWIRRLMQGLAAEGRTVFVSSHLMSEMALTATELVVIGRGRLISQGTVDDFVTGATDATIRVVTPNDEVLSAVLAANGISAKRPHRDTFEISGTTSQRVGEIAAGAGVVLYELVEQRASLEEAFLLLTAESTEYTSTGGPGRPGAVAGTSSDSHSDSTVAVVATAGR